MALTLDFTPDLHFSGTHVQGNVKLNLNEARSQQITCVRVKLRGNIKTIVNQYTGTTVNPIPGHRECVRQDQELWTPGASFPPQGDVLTLPFDFILPPDLPPSNHTSSALGKATCRYHVQAVADRQGLLRRNRKIKQAFPLLPDDTPGWSVKQQLDQGGWPGDWQLETASDQVRRLIWQEHGQVTARLHLPATAVLPLATNIPFKLELVTKTRPLREKDLHKKESDDHLFPYPPDMADIKVELKTTHYVRSDHSLKAQWNKSQEICKGNTFEEVRTQPDTKQLADDKYEIHQSNTITGAFVLNTTSPSYDSEIHTVQHTLVVKIPFKGLTNNLSFNLPVVVTSGCSTQDYEHAVYEMLPDYYDVVESDDEGDGDDKKSIFSRFSKS